eukprot:CAMPEP_0174820884 /NCGR_PEP_ID=MMETSP1107-20130205/5000_1 /TAXON_ID=36770 /ORGANISM="Paraphysomonas vestita, Strain GFlagA" /LENGTH=103 /DNA_ID=CAMNT_0016037085 /DNA_START=353 /DNA_END=664 /DNA_ORIENTATION=-
MLSNLKNAVRDAEIAARKTTTKAASVALQSRMSLSPSKSSQTSDENKEPTPTPSSVENFSDALAFGRTLDSNKIIEEPLIGPDIANLIEGFSGVIDSIQLVST